MYLTLDPRNVRDYETFLRVKQLPLYRITGREAWFPDEYADKVRHAVAATSQPISYVPSPFLFDYQAGISSLAIRKRKFAAFVRCGLGKTLIMLEFAHAARVALPPHRKILIVSPLMVIPQTLAENSRWYPSEQHAIEQIPASRLAAWLKDGKGGVAITNYDALTDEIEQGDLGALLLDESSMMKSAYGKWAQKCLELGRGLDWKLCLTGTPAPNDRIEYANHAVFLDHFPTVNSFLARFFVNRGQTDNRWELKPHALEPFYRALSHWAIFLNNPATYGWKDNSDTIPPIHVHIDHIDLTPEQTALVRKITGQLITTELGGITSRSTLGQIAKGNYKGEEVPTLKFDHMRRMVESWPDESTIIWCHYNDEQERCSAMLPGCANIDGSTPHEERLRLIDDFKAGRRKVLVSKPRILGFGLNLQVATRMVWSGLQDSYEEYVQGIARANRVGSTRPLHVHIPVTELERPMIETVLRKAAMVDHDTAEQERIFKQNGINQWTC